MALIQNVKNVTFIAGSKRGEGNLNVHDVSRAKQKGHPYFKPELSGSLIYDKCTACVKAKKSRFVPETKPINNHITDKLWS